MIAVRSRTQPTLQSPKHHQRRAAGIDGAELAEPPLAARTSDYASRPLSIADLLDSTVEEGIEFLSAFSDSRPARAAVKRLGLLAEVGLGYLKLGQPINTLSGGESQRLKLVRHLADSDAV